MKGILFSFLLTSLLITGYSFAQTEKQYNKAKERIQKELKVDEVKADSTASILRRYFTTIRSIRENEGISDEKKQLAIRKEKRAGVARLRTFLTESQLKKLRQMVQQYKEMRQRNNGEIDDDDTTLSKYYF